MIFLVFFMFVLYVEDFLGDNAAILPRLLFQTIMKCGFKAVYEKSMQEIVTPNTVIEHNTIQIEMRDVLKILQFVDNNVKFRHPYNQNKEKRRNIFIKYLPEFTCFIMRLHGLRMNISDEDRKRRQIVLYQILGPMLPGGMPNEWNYALSNLSHLTREELRHYDKPPKGPEPSQQEQKENFDRRVKKKKRFIQKMIKYMDLIDQHGGLDSLNNEKALTAAFVQHGAAKVGKKFEKGGKKFLQQVGLRHKKRKPDN